MRKIKIIANISVDRVNQSPGGTDGSMLEHNVEMFQLLGGDATDDMGKPA